MLHLSIMELFFRAVPDSIILIMGAHIFSRANINNLKVLKSVIFMSFVIYLIRCLPITFGIHTLLGVVGVTIVSVKFHKIDLIKALKAVFFTVFIQYLSEIINMAWIQICLGKNLELIFSNPTAKILYGIPSMLITSSTLYLCYLKYRSRKELTNNEN